MTDECPKCKANLVGEKIPEDQRYLFGDQTHFKRVIGVSDIFKDRVTHWRCPDCGYEWERS